MFPNVLILPYFFSYVMEVGITDYGCYADFNCNRQGGASVYVEQVGIPHRYQMGTISLVI